MNATRVNLSHYPDISTVKKLREWLDAQEAAWTDEDMTYMGRFEDIGINTFGTTPGYSAATATWFVNGDITIYATADRPNKKK